MNELPSWLLQPVVAVGLLSLLAVGGLALALRRRPPLAPLSPWLQLCLACSALWICGETVAATATTLGIKRAGLVLLYSGSIFLPAIWLVTLLRFCRMHSPELGRVRSPVEEAPIALASGIWLVMLSDPLHGGFVQPVLGARNLHQPLFGVFLAIAWIEVGIATVATLRLSRTHGSPVVRRASAELSVASAAPLLANAAYWWAGHAFPSLWTGVVLAGAALLAARAVGSGRGIWLLSPGFRRAAERDPDAVVLIDGRRRPVYWNRAARRALPGFAFDAEASAVDRLAQRLWDPRTDAPAGSGKTLLHDVAEAGAAGRLYRDPAQGGAWLRLSELPEGALSELPEGALSEREAGGHDAPVPARSTPLRIESLPELGPGHPAVGAPHDAFQREQPRR